VGVLGIPILCVVHVWNRVHSYNENKHNHQDVKVHIYT